MPDVEVLMVVQPRAGEETSPWTRPIRKQMLAGNLPKWFDTQSKPFQDHFADSGKRQSQYSFMKGTNWVEHADILENKAELMKR
jgi:hypothetical protein